LRWELAAGLLAGAVADLAFGDPARLHPVAGFGRVARYTERFLYRDHQLAGAVHTGLLVAAATGLGVMAERATPCPDRSSALGAGAGSGAGPRTGRGLGMSAGRRERRERGERERRRPVARAGLVAVATWTVLGGTTLRRTGRHLAAEVARGDLPAACRRLPSLCGRDPSALDAAGLARAAVESLAENTSDAAVAPLLWGAVAGIPGLLGYRAVNTLDAMVGYRNARYRRFGWAAARLDDAVNVVPARLSALLACVCTPAAGGTPADAYWVMRRDGHSHPSPNAGQVEAAFAGALGVRLGGELRYPHGVENRPRLGFGRPPAGDDVERAADLSGAVTLAAVGLCAALSLVMPPALSEIASRASRSTSAVVSLPAVNIRACALDSLDRRGLRRWCVALRRKCRHGDPDRTSYSATYSATPAGRRWRRQWIEIDRPRTPRVTLRRRRMQERRGTS
jgi:adenosylcobinamide-phosphate synthase